MKRAWSLTLAVVAAALTACASAPPTRPAGWNAPEVLVAPSSFGGVHGLAIDTKGRLLAGRAANLCQPGKNNRKAPGDASAL